MKWIKGVLGAREQAGPVEAAAAPATVLQAGLQAGPVYTRYPFSDQGSRIAAIGDLHGRVDLLQSLVPILDRLAADPARQLIEIYLGDYVDRGSDASGVIGLLAARQAQASHPVICLAGNHERMLLSALETDRDFVSWLAMGGHSTLLSYGLPPNPSRAEITDTRLAFRHAIPSAHLAFLNQLHLCYHHAEFFFAHAGVRPGKPLEMQSERDLLWIRNSFLKSNANFGAVVVHGHTPVERPEFRPNRIGIDTGAYHSGNLTCLTITSDAVIALS